MGAGIFITSCWIKTTGYLLNNMQFYKDNLHPDANVPNFRKNPTINNLVDDIVSQLGNIRITKPAAETGMLADISSSDDEERRQPDKRRLFTSDSEEEQIAEPPKKKKKKQEKKEL